MSSRLLSILQFLLLRQTQPCHARAAAWTAGRPAQATMTQQDAHSQETQAASAPKYGSTLAPPLRRRYFPEAKIPQEKTEGTWKSMDEDDRMMNMNTNDGVIHSKDICCLD